MDTVTAVLQFIMRSIALIAGLVISGKGGGLSDMLGGPGASEHWPNFRANLSRITAFVAFLFAVTSLSLFWF